MQGREGTSVCATLSAEDAAPGRAGDELLVRTVAGGSHGEHVLDGGIDGRGQVVVEWLAVHRTQRHVDDVDVIVDVPSPFGSTREFHGLCSSAMPLHDVAGAEQAFTAYNCTPGATPLMPPMMSATCVP